MHILLHTTTGRTRQARQRGGHGRRGTRNVAGAALGVLMGMLVSGCEPQVEIVIFRAPDFVGVVEHLKLQIVVEGTEAPLEYGPFGSAAVLEEQFATVPPETPFYVDVMGCLGPTPDQCDEDVEFIARGCSAWETVSRDTSGMRVEVEIDRGAVGAERCPPPPPGEDG